MKALPNPSHCLGRREALEGTEGRVQVPPPTPCPARSLCVPLSDPIPPFPYKFLTVVRYTQHISYHLSAGQER